MGPRYTSKYECFIGIQIYEAISFVMVTHTSAVDACDIMQEILQDYEINHPVRTRIDRVWDALARWCTIRQATHERIRGALPATASSPARATNSALVSMKLGWPDVGERPPRI